MQRSETVRVEVAGREGFVRRPSLVGALVVKAAAHGNPGDAARGRHRRDFVMLARLLRACRISVKASLITSGTAARA